MFPNDVWGEIKSYLLYPKPNTCRMCSTTGDLHYFEKPIYNNYHHRLIPENDWIVSEDDFKYKIFLKADYTGYYCYNCWLDLVIQWGERFNQVGLTNKDLKYIKKTILFKYHRLSSVRQKNNNYIDKLIHLHILLNKRNKRSIIDIDLLVSFSNKKVFTKLFAPILEEMRHNRIAKEYINKVITFDAYKYFIQRCYVKADYDTVKQCFEEIPNKKWYVKDI